MDDQRDSACAERLRTALDLMESGIQMRMVQLRRAHPDEDDTAIRQRLNDWLLSRADADYEGPMWRRVDPASLLAR